jgi:3-hydroxybutyrate dehydrogenase
VKLLHAKNCNIVIGDLSLTEDGKKVVDAAEKAKGAKILFKKTDVSDWKQLEALFEFTKSEVGVADIVCPSAGTFSLPFAR